MSDEVTAEQIETLRQEAAEARRLAATFSDPQAVADLTLYAEALEVELAKLTGDLMEPEHALLPPAEASILARLSEHA